MNNLNFNYWLQGYFELLPQGSLDEGVVEIPFSLDGNQVRMIKEHLALVKKVEVLSGFAAWLEGYLEAVGTSVNEAQSLIIRTKLHASFAHQPVTNTPFQSWTQSPLSIDGLTTAVC